MEKKFAEPQVQKTFTEVVTKGTASIMEEKIDPAVANLNAFIEEQRSELRTSVASVQEEIEQLRKAAEYQGKLREIQRLVDNAFLGSAQSWDRLVDYKSDDPDLTLAAVASRERLKSAFVGITLFNNKRLEGTRPDGTNVTEANITTGELIHVLQHESSWLSRGRAARLLRNKKEFRVLEILIESMQTDEDLRVRHEALQSFNKITGQRTGALKFESAQQYFENSRAELREKFPPPSESSSPLP